MKNLKNAVKKVIPGPILEAKHHRSARKDIWNEFKQDYITYSNSALLGLGEYTQKQLLGIIIFKTHSVEKGLSHVHFRPNFGRNTALAELHMYLTEYRRLNFDETHPFILNAISVLHEYLDRHNAENIDVQWFEDWFEDWLDVENTHTAGAKVIEHRDSTQKNFRDLSLNRYSVREFSEEPVEMDKIVDSIGIAMKTPSVCNRSPWGVKVISDKKMMNDLLSIQGGFAGYTNPDKLLLVTVNTAYFNGLGERNQPYIEGGLFTMSLLYALESNNLAAVALNAMFMNERTEKVRTILKLQPSEVLITFIAVGQFTKNSIVAKSFRPTIDEIVDYY